MDHSLPPALMLMGPTASGKTALALALATTLQARGQAVEIISVDSALVYRDMDIGTAKPTRDEQAVCPHHLIDICTPLEAYSAAAFRADACRLMAEITQRGALPLLVGGTMLYFKALRDGLSDLPAADPGLRRRIEDDAARLGWPALHAELAGHDPDAAARLHPSDAQRIQRALEIVLVTGRPLADSYAQRETVSDLPCQLLPVALIPSDRAVLHARIGQRFEQMLAAGFIDEVRQLRIRWPGLQADMTSMRCVGYRQVWDWLDGTLNCHHRQHADQELRAQGIAATRQLAKRQLTWLRQFSEQWPELMVVDCLSSQLLTTVLALYDSVTRPPGQG